MGIIVDNLSCHQSTSHLCRQRRVQDVNVEVSIRTIECFRTIDAEYNMVLILGSSIVQSSIGGSGGG